MKIKDQETKKPRHDEVDDDFPFMEEDGDASDTKSIEDDLEIIADDTLDDDVEETLDNSVVSKPSSSDEIIDDELNEPKNNDQASEDEMEAILDLSQDDESNKSDLLDESSNPEIDTEETSNDDDSKKGFVFGGAALPPKKEIIDSNSADQTNEPVKEEKESNTNMLREKQAFRASKNFKLGIVGSKGVGKSYLFHSMVYRLINTIQAGALSYFLKDSNIEIWETIDKSSNAIKLGFTDFLENYIDWRRLAPTKKGTQKWYRLSIPYRSGLLGRAQRSIDVEFFDGAGETYSEGDSDSQKYWEDNFKDASVIVFCLPLWVAFPIKEHKNAKLRREILNGFERVVNAYQELRNSENIKISTKSILALTMSDEVEKTSLNSDLVETWLKPYMLDSSDDSPDASFFKKMNNGGAVNRYLANARKVSNILNKKFKTSNDVLVSNVPESLAFKAGLPWIIPVSAIRGDFLQTIEDIDEQNKERPDNFSLPDHNPAHVELPLLVALCEHTNALM